MQFVFRPTANIFDPSSRRIAPETMGASLIKEAFVGGPMSECQLPFSIESTFPEQTIVHLSIPKLDPSWSLSHTMFPCSTILYAISLFINTCSMHLVVFKRTPVAVAIFEKQCPSAMSTPKF